jgi:hypothetical protein
MAEPKTKETTASVEAFLHAITDARMREDCTKVAALMREITGEEGAMWGTSIVGFGRFHFRSKSKCEGDWFLTGFAPRAKELSLYLIAGFEHAGDLLQRLGRHRTGKGCLYLRRLEDVDPAVLEELIRISVAQTRAAHP